MGLASGHSKLKELERIISEFQDQLFRFAFFRTGKFDDSKDIVQEVFIKLYHENESLATVINIKQYLFKSISNACIDYRRKQKNFKFMNLEQAILPNDIHEKDVSDNLIQVEEYKRLERLLCELPEEQSEVIRLRVFDNLSFIEISSILEIPVTTTKSRFKYGIDKLKDKIIASKEVYYGMQ